MSLVLYAAGSLREALGHVAEIFGRSAGLKVDGTFGPSGLLRGKISAGARADVFASANTEHPAALAKAGKAGPVAIFARNVLCALVRPGLKLTPDGLLTAMLDPQIKLGTSTPQADPSGDYAFAVFAKAEALSPGAQAALAGKARQLTGGPLSRQPQPGRNFYGQLVAEGEADIFLTYRTGALVAQAENPGQQIVSLPASLGVGADYGLTVIAGAADGAQNLAAFILSKEGQAILAEHGFLPPRGMRAAPGPG
jgi:ABC-type molybdate transport system substrate-binding protein